MPVEKYGYRGHSGGPRRNRGGVGVERTYRFLDPGTDRAFEVGQRCSDFVAAAAMSSVTGGREWGDPLVGDVVAAAAEVEPGFVGLEQAGSDYGVAIDAVTIVVGEAETNRLRSGQPS